MIHISKQLACLKYIYKIHSRRLRENKWDLALPLSEARRNDELISIGDNQILRWIDEFNGITDADAKARELKSQIRQLHKQEASLRTKRELQSAYTELDKLQFKPDYMFLVIDAHKDYYRACKGFNINGVTYRRLLGTNGGIKNSTIIFVSERYHDELRRRIDNSRNLNTEFVTAKLEAYKALTCSTSNPVSMPNGLIVVKDAETEFFADVTYISDEADGDPVVKPLHNQLIKNNASDGFGLMLPSLAARWSRELGLDYTVSGLNSRFAFTKGMVFTFDFISFAEKVAHSYIVKDIWGNEVDIRNVELILTESMVKLWDSYDSCADFINKSLSNGYSFGISKTTPKKLESERTTNYQFLQSYNFSDADIDELIAPTVREFHDILRNDWHKTVLFLAGTGLTENKVRHMPNDYVKALMIDRRILSDPFVRQSVYRQIRNKINEAKTGVIKVHGNYSIVSGDPYLLCQSIFGLEKTGLLKEGEIYNKYWSDCGAKKLACFRAPMSIHANIRLVHPVANDDMNHWYKYMNTVTILNSWDTATIALNGCDFDGDLVMLTDNDVLVSKLVPQPALMCVQRKAPKRISTEEDFIRSNIENFGNEIGQTTNWITSMYDVRSGFELGSKEYEALSYRITCGQHYQQNSIDKAKGIICRSMPREWHDRHAVGKIANEEIRGFYRGIVADKKPYFMRYIYPALSKQYNQYIKNTNRKAMREFGMTVVELKQVPDEDLTGAQIEFLDQFDRYMPVGANNCVVNSICRKFEAEFDSYFSKYPNATDFDYTFMRSDTGYTKKQFLAIKRILFDYDQKLADIQKHSSRHDPDTDAGAETIELRREFRRECDLICPSGAALCDIILDLCYSRDKTKAFAWGICGDEIVDNLLARNNGVMSYPVCAEEGNIEFGSNRFAIETIRLEDMV